MTALRRRMTEDLQLRGYADRTITAYVFAVSQLARFHGISPDRITEEQIREYLLHLTNVRKVAASSFSRPCAASSASMSRRSPATGPCSTWRARSASSGSPSC